MDLKDMALIPKGCFLVEVMMSNRSKISFFEVLDR